MGSQSSAAPLDPNEQRRTITEIIKHPNFNTAILDNDIAVIKVSGTFNCGTNINPACLPNPNVRSSKFSSPIIYNLSRSVTSTWIGKTLSCLVGVLLPTMVLHQAPCSGLIFPRLLGALVTSLIITTGSSLIIRYAQVRIHNSVGVFGCLELILYGMQHHDLNQSEQSISSVSTNENAPL